EWFASWLYSFPSANDRIWSELDEDRSPLRQLDVSGPMTSAGGVFHQKHVAAPKDAATAIGDFELDRAVEQHDELTRRRRMPVVVVILLVHPEDDRLGLE